MYKKIADNITKQIIKNKEVDCNNFEVYSYGFELLISYCSYLLLLAIIAGITKSIIDTLMFSMGFIMLRKFSGGYHASTYLKCHIYFILNQLMFIAFVKILPFNIYQYFILSFSLISTLIVFLLAPIDHSNRSFNKKEYIYFRKRSRKFIIIVLITTLIMIHFSNTYKLLISYLFGVFSASCSIIAGAIQKKKRLN